MALRYDTLLGPVDKVQIAIDRLKAFEPEEGYFLAFSGGKDSQVIYHLAVSAGVKFDAHYQVTSVDPPEAMRFVHEHYPDVAWDHPKGKDGKPITMWTLIKKNRMLPNPNVRFCCKELKEKSGQGRIVVTGVRWAESARRRRNSSLIQIAGGKRLKSRQDIPAGPYEAIESKYGICLNYDNDVSKQLVEQCYKKYRTTVNPIIDWDDQDVWEYLSEIGVGHCSLYDEGFIRIGCIGCPLKGVDRQIRDFRRWPRYLELYDKACMDACCRSMSDWLGIGGKTDDRQG